MSYDNLNYHHFLTSKLNYYNKQLKCCISLHLCNWMFNFKWLPDTFEEYSEEQRVCWSRLTDGTLSCFLIFTIIKWDLWRSTSDNACYVRKKTPRFCLLMGKQQSCSQHIAKINISVFLADYTSVQLERNITRMLLIY